MTVMNPNGAPTPVAWTRMRAPRASMAPMPADWLASGVAASALQAKYGQAVDRDSAYEMLARKLEAGAARAAAEAAEVERAREDAARERAGAPRSSRTTSRSQPKSGVEKVLSSPTFWNQVMRVGSQVVRTMWGTARR